MRLDFQDMMKRILSHEGGYTINPLDKGNWTRTGALKGTKYGISARSYPHLDIKNLTWDMACDIYYEDFFLTFMVSVPTQSARFQLLDYAINSGVPRATKALQKAVGAKPDGILGPKTRFAAVSVDDTVITLRVLAYRLEFMASLPRWKTFGGGWARRIAANIHFAVQDLK